MSSTGSEDEKPQKHAVNGVSKRKLNSRVGRARNKYGSYNSSDQQMADSGDKRRRSVHIDSREQQFNGPSDHTYHSPRRSQGRVKNDVTVGRGRKRPKPPSDSESNHSEHATTSSLYNRPKRSVKRKNYAAMVASGSEDNEDDDNDDVEDMRRKKVVDKGKSLVKTDYKRVMKGSQKKLYEDKSVNSRSNNINSNNSGSSNIYSTRRAFIKQDKSKNYEESSNMRTRPMKKKVNYDEENWASSSDSTGKEEMPVNCVGVGEHERLSVRGRGRRNISRGGKLQTDATSNGYATSRVMRTHKKVVYNEEDEEEEVDNDEQNSGDEYDQTEQDDNRHHYNNDEDIDDEEDDEDDDEFDGRNDRLDEDFELKGKSVRKVSLASRSVRGRRRGGGYRKQAFSQGQGHGRKRRKRSTSDSENERRYYGTSSRPQAGRRTNFDEYQVSALRRSSRPHRPLKDSEDLSLSSEDESSLPQYSVSSRGRIRKLSPRVCAFLRD